MPLMSPVKERFVLHWGEMGTRWGVNRTVAQIHALLYMSERPLNAEEIAEALSVARSNVSTSLRELEGWGLVNRVGVLGDRRDHFETMSDVWDMFMVVLDERKRREIDPTLALLRQCMAESSDRKRSATDYERERLGEMLSFFETTSRWYTQIRALPRNATIKFIKMGSKLGRVLGVESA